MTGSQLRAWRERHGLTQAEAAPLLGTNQQRVNEQEQREAVRPYYARLVEVYERHGIDLQSELVAIRQTLGRMSMDSRREAPIPRPGSDGDH